MSFSIAGKVLTFRRQSGQETWCRTNLYWSRLEVPTPQPVLSGKKYNNYTSTGPPTYIAADRIDVCRVNGPVKQGNDWKKLTDGYSGLTGSWLT